MGVFYLAKQRYNLFKVKHGRGTWGRTGPLETVDVETVGTLSAKVIRTDGTVEDLGVISSLTSEVNNGNSSN